MTEKNYSVALVGCGSVAQNHLNAITMLGNVEIVALCDVITERANALKERFAPKAKIYDSYEKMLECEKLDSIHICTPHYLHFPMASLALKKNINVFLEKPMTTTIEDADKLIEIEKESKAKLCICFQNRFLKAVADAKRIITEDGGVEAAFCSVFWKRTKEYYVNSGWRGRYETEGGGVMINQAIHTLDLLTQFIGKPKSVRATTSNHHLSGIIEVEDTCEGVIYFENGKQANFYATTSAMGCDDTRIVLETKNHNIELRLPNITVDGVTTSYENDMHFIGKKCYGNGHEQLIARYYEALSTGEDIPVSAESAKCALSVLLAAYKSQDTEINI